MFLVNDQQPGITNLVFTVADPRKDGYTGDVIEGVDLDYDMERVHGWPDGEPRPEEVVGRANGNAKLYKVFKYRSELLPANYEYVPGMAVVLGSWADYRRLLGMVPWQEDEETWLNYLDAVDEGSRRRRQLAPMTPLPASANRDEVAAWLARTHFLADTGIREVWYLPQGAPAGEIRLLELNDRYVGNDAQIQALDFGLDIEGAPFRLVVADITTDQLGQIMQEPARLPSGWSFNGSRNWKRGA